MRSLNQNEIAIVSGGLDTNIDNTFVVYEKYKIYRTEAARDGVYAALMFGGLSGIAATAAFGAAPGVLVGAGIGLASFCYEYYNSEIWPSYLK